MAREIVTSENKAEHDAKKLGLKEKEPRIISSQRYIDDDIVDKKLKNKDFQVTLSKPFKYNGEDVHVLSDGHHSFEAAKLAKVKPKYKISTDTEDDRNLLLKQKHKKALDDFLESHWMDSPFYDVKTGKEFF
jgi:hypothetical protein